MVTITHTNRCAEMLATVRRGPFAASTQEEKIEFLLTRMKKSDCKVAFADHALEHTLSFQRRVRSIKQDFLRRGVATPLGITQDIVFCYQGRVGSACTTRRSVARARTNHMRLRELKREHRGGQAFANNDLQRVSGCGWLVR